LTRYIIERLFFVLLTVFLIVSLSFLLLQFMPGSPFNDEKLTDEQREILYEKYGLNDPIATQYARYMSNIMKGDFGQSFKFNKPVTEMIIARVKVSGIIGFQALIFGAVVGIVLGAVAALKRNSFWDHFTTILAVVGVSIPSFVLGSLMQYYFSVKLRWLPVVYSKTFVSTIMPTIALSLFVISSTARYMRTELIEVLNSDYILLSRAKGLSQPVIIAKHALRNALIPVITILGPMTVSILAGSTVIERIFGVPGLGNLIVTAIQTNDYFVILGEGTFYSLIFLTVILIVDILYGIIDPRIRLAGGDE